MNTLFNKFFQIGGVTPESSKGKSAKSPHSPSNNLVKDKDYIFFNSDIQQSNPELYPESSRGITQDLGSAACLIIASLFIDTTTTEIPLQHPIQPLTQILEPTNFWYVYYKSIIIWGNHLFYLLQSKVAFDRSDVFRTGLTFHNLYESEFTESVDEFVKFQETLEPEKLEDLYGEFVGEFKQLLDRTRIQNIKERNTWKHCYLSIDTKKHTLTQEDSSTIDIEIPEHIENDMYDSLLQQQKDIMGLGDSGGSGAGDDSGVTPAIQLVPIRLADIILQKIDSNPDRVFGFVLTVIPNLSCGIVVDNKNGKIIVFDSHSHGETEHSGSTKQLGAECIVVKTTEEDVFKLCKHLYSITMKLTDKVNKFGECTEIDFLSRETPSSIQLDIPSLGVTVQANPDDIVVGRDAPDFGLPHVSLTDLSTLGIDGLEIASDLGALTMENIGVDVTDIARVVEEVVKKNWEIVYDIDDIRVDLLWVYKDLELDRKRYSSSLEDTVEKWIRLVQNNTLYVDMGSFITGAINRKITEPSLSVQMKTLGSTHKYDIYKYIPQRDIHSIVGANAYFNVYTPMVADYLNGSFTSNTKLPIVSNIQKKYRDSFKKKEKIKGQRAIVEELKEEFRMMRSTEAIDDEDVAPVAADDDEIVISPVLSDSDSPHSSLIDLIDRYKNSNFYKESNLLWNSNDTNSLISRNYQYHPYKPGRQNGMTFSEFNKLKYELEVPYASPLLLYNNHSISMVDVDKVIGELSVPHVSSRSTRSPLSSDYNSLNIYQRVNDNSYWYGEKLLTSYPVYYTESSLLNKTVNTLRKRRALGESYHLYDRIQKEPDLLMQGAGVLAARSFCSGTEPSDNIYEEIFSYKLKKILFLRKSS